MSSDGVPPGENRRMVRRFWAPGRVNLIGEHTDYSGGLVLPAAIDLGLVLEGEPHDRIELTSAQEAGSVRLNPDGTGGSQQGWGRYVAAVASELAALGRPPRGWRGTLSSTLPAGAGLSSSAALEVVVATTLCAVSEFEMDPLSLVQACQRAEQRAVGVPSGVMDQAASTLGRANCAVLLDCSTLVYEHVALPADLALLVIDSGVSRQLEESGYGQRRQELEAGLAALDGRRPSEVTLSELDGLLAGLDDIPARRVRHVVSENARVLATKAALSRPAGADRDALAQLFAASHASLRDDFEVTVSQTDLLVELCGEHGAVAARMTGGGFGGAIVALVPAERADGVGAAVVHGYGERQSEYRATAIPCRAGDGARELT